MSSIIAFALILSPIWLFILTMPLWAGWETAIFVFLVTLAVMGISWLMTIGFMIILAIDAANVVSSLSQKKSGK